MQAQQVMVCTDDSDILSDLSTLIEADNDQLSNVMEVLVTASLDDCEWQRLAYQAQVTPCHARAESGGCLRGSALFSS